MSYVPRAGSLPDRVCRWFVKEPEEVLNAADIALKFDVPNKDGISTQLAPAVSAKLLNAARNSRGVLCFTAGPELATALAGRRPEALGNPAGGGEAVSGFKGCLAAKGDASAEGRPARVALPDPATLVIEHDVPIPELQLAPRKPRYTDVWERMEKGDSFAVQPAQAKRLIQSAGRFAKPLGRKFVTRTLADGTARIWRSE